MNKLAYTAAADADLQDIFEYTEFRWGIAQAEKYITDLQETCELLARMPQMGRSLGELRPNLRQFVRKRHLILYRPDRNGITVVRVLHVRAHYVRNLLLQ